MKKLVGILALALVATFANTEDVQAQYQQSGYTVAATANAQFKGKVQVDKSVSVGDDVALSGASTCIEFRDTDKAVLLPKLTSTQRGALDSLVSGLLIFNTTTGKLNVYDGSAWKVCTFD